MPEELTDANFWSFIHSEDEGITRNAIQQLILGEGTLRLEHRFRCADGSYKHLSWCGSALPEERLIYAIARDVTKRKRLEVSLAERSRTLETTIQKLHQTQTQLVQSAKMSSLGQLVAGVAHEINNPINFISGNISHVKEYTESLLEILNAYRDRYPKPDRKIVELMEELEFDFLLEDLPAVLRSMQLGTTRIRDIILSLRNFSRLDEATIKSVDIHEGLDSTLLILQSRINANLDRAEINVQRHYGDLPKVECYPGQLNQVFMNILSNAIDAIAISKKALRGVIRITTTVEPEEGMAVIYIRDNDYRTPSEVFLLSSSEPVALQI
jgi:signal transduction histidine kinase